MNARNPSVGRHAVGSPIAKSGTKPKPRTGSASGNVVGTGVNKKSAAKAEYKPTGSKLNDNNQLGQWLDQAPEPFRNSQPSANPRSYSTSTSVSPKGYEATSGQRAGSGGYGSKPTQNFPAAATGPKGGLGQENGRVVGKSQPRRVGNANNQPRGSSSGGFKGRGGAPSFYGR